MYPECVQINDRDRIDNRLTDRKIKRGDMHMENSVKVINRVGRDISVRVNNADGVIAVTVEYPENRIRLSHLNPGDVFKADGLKYIVLEHFSNGTTAAIRKDVLQESRVFDFDDNNWKTSNIRRFLNSEYLEELNEVFGESNIMNHAANLVSLDGLKDYGKCTDKVSLLSVGQYWKYREVIGDILYDSDKEDDSWWLTTPDSTSSGFGGNDMLYVGSMGDIGCSPCNFHRGIRPYFVLRDSAMVVLSGHVESEM